MAKKTTAILFSFEYEIDNAVEKHRIKNYCVFEDRFVQVQPLNWKLEQKEVGPQRRDHLKIV